MTYKMYLMSITGLDEEYLWQDAMCLLDNSRKEIVHKYRNEKDRMRAIVAGLLLQIGFMELEPDTSFAQMTEENFYLLDSKKCVEYLKELSIKMSGIFPVELTYGTGEQGKPFWNKVLLQNVTSKLGLPDKKLWYFNLSHSGKYVALIVADVEVGVDIQEEREVKKFPGGYRAFSRMEAFVKCTGEGYAKGYREYKNHEGHIPGYEIQSIRSIDSYALNICFSIGDRYGVEKL